METMPVTTQKRSRSSLFVIKVKSLMKLLAVWPNYSHSVLLESWCIDCVAIPQPHVKQIWFLLIK